VVAALMLPLSFLTGLLGINVGGMPGTDNPTAFWIVCLLLLVFGLGQVWLFRKLRWI
jgi:zinc transporter